MTMRIAVICSGLAVLAGLSNTTGADQPPTLSASSENLQQSGRTALRDHAHKPIQIEARPIVARIRVPLARPRRVLLDSQQNIIVADWGAGSVLRINPAGDSQVLASDLPEPAGLAIDSSDTIFVCTHAGGLPGEGQIFKLSPGGMPMVFAEGLTGPTDLAFDNEGQLYVAEFQADRVSRVSTMGEVQTFLDDIASPAGLVFDSLGYLYCASSTDGVIYKTGPMGELVPLVDGLSVPSDLAFDADGHLIVANYGGVELLYVTNKGESRSYATVPKGTIGLCFDNIGNLLFVNWDYQTLMRVTTHLSVPCPHCGKSIPVRLRSGRPRPVATPPLTPII